MIRNSPVRRAYMLVVWAASAASATAAFAQPMNTDPIVADAGSAPAFATLDRGDATSRVGIEASDVSLGYVGGGPITAVRGDVHGQYVDPASGFGGYVELPITYFDASQAAVFGGPSVSGTGLGGTEVGALYVPRRVARGLGIVLRAGLVLPTGSTTDGGQLANTFSAPARVTDFYLTLPGATSLRIAVSALWRSGCVFARADLGVDDNLSPEGSPVMVAQAADTVIRANAGLGIQLGHVSLTAESTNLYDHAMGLGVGFGDQWIATGALAARLHLRPIDVYAAVVIPLDHGGYYFYGKTDSRFDDAVTVGMEAQLR